MLKKRAEAVNPAQPAAPSAPEPKRQTQAQPAAGGINFKEISISVLTDAFQAKGVMRAVGVIQTYLNDEQKSTISLYNAEAYGLRPENGATHIVQDELIIRKHKLQILAFDEMPAAGEITILQRAEEMAAYTDQFAIHCKFRMGPDALLVDFIDTALSQFIVATDLKIYPLFQPRIPLLASAPLALIQREAVRLYHKV
jgi:hypothetical protein